MAQSPNAPPAPPPTAPPTRAVITGMPRGYEKIVAVSLGGTDLKTSVDGSLVREISRQALLIAAEAELGLATLDDCIGEVIPSGTALPGPFTVNTIGVRQQQPGKFGNELPCEFTVTVLRSEPGGPKTHWTSPKVTYPNGDWYEPLVEQAEQMSRGPFVELLQKAGYQKSTAAPSRPAAITLDKQIDFVSQFAVIQNLHVQMRSSETPEVLEQIVQAYANLGSLTDFHWSPASKAYKARALLYAQRLIAKHGANPSSLAHRAYALALAGRHAAAVAAIQAADSATGKKSPDWLPVIEAYCLYKTSELDQTKGAYQPLARYLRTRMLDTQNDTHQSTKVLADYLKTNPGSCLTADLMASLESLGPKRYATETAFHQAWPHVYKQLAAVPDLPSGAKKIADGAKAARPDARSEYPKRKELIRQLAKSGAKNQPGPSWAALGSLLEEVSFAQAARIVLTEVTFLGMNPKRSLLELGPLMKGHRFEPFLQVFDKTRPDAAQLLADFIHSIDVPSLEMSTLPMTMVFVKGENVAIMDRMIELTCHNADNIFEDAYREKVLPYGQDNRYLAAISPHWPSGVIERLHIGKEDKDGEIEKQYSDSNVVLMALSRTYAQRNQLEDALRCMTKAIEIAPSCDSYIQLAAIHEMRGDNEAMVDALKSATTQPSLGLAKSHAHGELAHWYMSRGNWQDAKPHALEAAQSYSSYGLLTAARYYEGIEDWTEAEKYRRLNSQRYEQSAESWYFWCNRTGRGNIVDARAFAASHVKATTFRGNGLWKSATWYLLEGERAKAMEAFLALFKTGNQLAGLFAAVLLDEDRDSTRRNDIFDQMVMKGLGQQDLSLELSNCFRGVLSEKQPGRWNPQTFHTLILKTTNEWESPYFYLAAGLFLRNHGEKELSNQYLQCAATAYDGGLASVIATDQLRKSHVAIGKMRRNSFPDDFAVLATQIADARKSQKAREFGKAEATLTQLVESQKQFLPGLLARSKLYEAQGKYAEAVKDLESTIRVDPNYPYGHAGLARLLATCERDEIRNGPKALEHAEKAASFRYFDTWDALITLAWAHAECGHFEKAIEFEQKAEKLRGNDGRTRDRLALYTARKAYHVSSKARDAEIEPEPAKSPVAATFSPPDLAPEIRSRTSSQRPLARAPDSSKIIADGPPKVIPEGPLTIEPIGAPIDLLAQLDLKQNVLAGDWKRDGKALVGGRKSRVYLPAKLPDDYQLTLLARRVEGTDAMTIGFMMGGRQGLMSIDTQAGTVTGLLLDDRVAAGNCTTRRGRIFKDQIVTIILTVHPHHFHASCDGDTIVNWHGDPRRLNLPPDIGGESRESALLAVANAIYRIESATMAPIKPEQAVVRPAKLNDQTDLFPLINLQKDIQQGSWKLGGNNLESTSGMCKVYLPGFAPEEYTVSVTVELPGEHQGRYALAVGLVADNSYFQFTATEKSSGLDMIDGKRWDKNETRVDGSLLKPGVPVRLESTVTRDGVRVQADGKVLVDWKGDIRKLSVHGEWSTADSRRLSLGAFSRVKFREITIGPPMSR